MDIHEQLVKLAKDLYKEGYVAGIQDYDWFNAWALAMERVAGGEEYHDEMVNFCYKEFKEE